MVERSDIEELLEAFRIDEVEDLLADGSVDPELEESVTGRISETRARAQEMCDRLTELGEKRDLESIVELGHDPATHQLVALAPETVRKRAEIYLREAERWERKKAETNVRRLAEARRALDGLDLELARGLMKRIDGRYLSQSQEEERDQLLLDISAREMELEPLGESVRQQFEEADRDAEARRQPWWRRWFQS